MSASVIGLFLLVLVLLLAALAIKIVKQYELGGLFRLGRVIGTRSPGLRLMIPLRRRPAPRLAA